MVIRRGEIYHIGKSFNSNIVGSEQAIEIVKIEQERNIYKDLYEKLLEKMIG